MVCEELLQPTAHHGGGEQSFDRCKGACRRIGTRIGLDRLSPYSSFASNNSLAGISTV